MKLSGTGCIIPVSLNDNLHTFLALTLTLLQFLVIILLIYLENNHCKTFQIGQECRGVLLEILNLFNLNDVHYMCMSFQLQLFRTVSTFVTAHMLFAS